MSFSERRRGRGWWGGWVGALLAACGRDGGYTSQVHRLVPGWGLNTAPVSAVIEGENFLSVPTQHVGGEEHVTLESSFEVHLGGYPIEDVTWVDAHTLGIRVPGGLVPGWYPLTVRTPLGERVQLSRAYFASDRPLASLRVSSSPGPARLWVGEERRMGVTVDNPGATRALDVRARLLAAEPGGVEIRSQPAAQVLEPGGRASFEWTLGAASVGTGRFTLELEGTEELSGLVLRAAPAAGAIQVDARLKPSPSSALRFSSPAVSEGLSVTVTLRVTNPSEGDPLRVARPDKPVVEGGDVLWTAEPPLTPLSLGPGESGDFVWTALLKTPGALNFKAQALITQERTGDAVPIAAAASALTVLKRGRLVASFQPLPASGRVGVPFAVNIEVGNTGESPVLQVAPDAGDIVAGNTNCHVALSPPSSSASPYSPSEPVNRLEGGARTVFIATLTGTQAGSCAFQVRVKGVDALPPKGAVVSDLVTSTQMTLLP